MSSGVQKPYWEQNADKILDELKVTARIESVYIPSEDRYIYPCKPKDFAKYMKREIEEVDYPNIKATILNVVIIQQDVFVVYFKISKSYEPRGRVQKFVPMEVTTDFLDSLHTRMNFNYGPPCRATLATLTYSTQRQQMEQIEAILALRENTGKFMGPAEELMKKYLEGYTPQVLDE